MSDAWISKIAEINQKTGVEPDSPVPVANIMQAFEAAGISKEDQAKILAGFMATVDVKPADVAPAAPPAPTKLTLAQIMDMAGDPSKAEQLKAAIAALSDADKQALIPQVQALKPADAAKLVDVSSKLVQPVLIAINTINSIASGSLPKRTKMLDVIQQLNTILPTPALDLKDDKGVPYSQKLITLLNTHKDKFGTTSTPGDKFVSLITTSIQANKPIELPQAALESMKLHKHKTKLS
jgi:hypothetical protein